MKEIVRIVLGLLFVFSGFVKVVDPMGGAIKIDDYFVAWGLEVPFMVSVVLSVIQNVAEFIVGFLLLSKTYVPLASFGAMLFMIFFTPLTLYIAVANPVTDCGCFGDAVKLSNWETFLKNLVFLPLSIYLFMVSGTYKDPRAEWRKIGVVSIGLVIAMLVQMRGLTDEPILDFRPYHIGQDIRAAMQIPDDAPQAEYKTTFILRKDGVEKEFDENSYPYNDTTWQYVDTHTEVLKEGYIPEIHDFTIVDAAGDMISNQLLDSKEPIVLMVAPQLNEVTGEQAVLVLALKQICDKNDIDMYVLTASVVEQQREFTDRIQRYDLQYLTADETMLKTVVRSKAGVVILQNGVIINKFAIKNMPRESEWKSPLASTLNNINVKKEQLIVFCIILAAVLGLMSVKTKRKERK